MNKLITLTGIDRPEIIPQLQDLAGAYTSDYGRSVVEFGILMSPKAGMSEVSPRYPRMDVVDKLTQDLPLENLAFHLCGDYARAALDTGRWIDLKWAIPFDRVSRVQINTTDVGPSSIMTAMRFGAFIGRQVIMQWRGPAFEMMPVQMLQDLSGGTGKLADRWISPDPLCKFGKPIGYAGGLSPDNIATEYPRIKDAARYLPFWVDCESGIRTDDLFDVEKARAMVNAVSDNYQRDTRDRIKI